VSSLKRIVKLSAMALLLASLLNVAAPVLAHYENNPYQADLIAGQYMNVGKVKVWNDGDHLYVKYVVTDPWKITETHLYVSTDEPLKAAPGKFPYKVEYASPVMEDTFEIDLNGWTAGTKLWIAAHAVVLHPDNGEDETAWAWGYCHWKDLPGKSWGWYFWYVVQKWPPPPP